MVSYENEGKILGPSLAVEKSFDFFRDMVGMVYEAVFSSGEAWIDGI